MRGQPSFDGTASGLSLPLALFYAGLIAYASLYPFHDWQFPGVTPWAFVLTPLPKYWSGFDVAINMLGYIPFGLLLASALNSVLRRPVIGAVLIAALFSFVMEALQNYVSPRVASNADWALNTAGAWVGACMTWAAAKMGLMRGWQRWREGRFDMGSGFVLGLLILWPLALLYPTPVPLGLGHGLGQLLGLQTQVLPHRLETLVIALGLLTPLLLAYAVTPQWTHRAVAWCLTCLAGFGVTTVTNGLSFGPEYATTWLEMPAQYGLMLGTGTGLILTLATRRFCWLLAFVSLVLQLTLQSTVALDPYFAQTLAMWEGGQFIRFYGATQWLGWLWPYAALLLVMVRISQLIKLFARR